MACLDLRENGSQKKTATNFGSLRKHPASTKARKRRNVAHWPRSRGSAGRLQIESSISKLRPDRIPSEAGLMVRDAPQAALLTMRVWDFATKSDLILRNPPRADISKDGPRRDRPPSPLQMRRPSFRREGPGNIEPCPIGIVDKPCCVRWRTLWKTADASRLPEWREPSPDAARRPSRKRER
jgi:hypothetical protein